MAVSITASPTHQPIGRSSSDLHTCCRIGYGQNESAENGISGEGAVARSARQGYPFVRQVPEILLGVDLLVLSLAGQSNVGYFERSREAERKAVRHGAAGKQSPER